MLIEGESVFDLASKDQQTVNEKQKLAKQQEAKNYLDFNANLLFLQYLLPKLVQCKQLEIPIAISIFAKKKKIYENPNVLVEYEKDLYVINTHQFEQTSTKELWCNPVELSSFLLESGLDVNFTFLNENEIKIKVSKALEKKQENPVLCKKVND